MLESDLKITTTFSPTLVEFSEPYYFALLMEGQVDFSVDFNDYQCTGKCILFLSPFQHLKVNPEGLDRITMLRFHGDFYCIEYHKEEVACNGILFNNIYDKPFIAPPAKLFNQVAGIFSKIKELEGSASRYDVAVARTYLQLILALCSREKQRQYQDGSITTVRKTGIQDFDTLLERHFSQSKSVAFYADQYHLSVGAFSKKIKKHFGKTPSILIRERMVLEAKKKLHLTYKSVREVAHELGFEDEFYFSRYFKKAVGVSPATFREEVGISIVAKKSM